LAPPGRAFLPTASSSSAVRVMASGKQAAPLVRTMVTSGPSGRPTVVGQTAPIPMRPSPAAPLPAHVEEQISTADAHLGNMAAAAAMIGPAHNESDDNADNSLSPRKKRKSVEEPSAPLPPTNVRAHEVLLTRISNMTGLPRGCIQLEAPAGADGKVHASKLRVHIKCTAMLQPRMEWVHHQTWLKRQQELAGDEEPTEADSPGRRQGCFRSRGRARVRPPPVSFSPESAHVVLVQSSWPEEDAATAAVKEAAAAEQDPSLHLQRMMRID